MITLKETVYADTGDGRVVLVGIEGDEIEESLAELYGVKKDGTGSGVKPPTKLLPTDGSTATVGKGKTKGGSK